MKVLFLDHDGVICFPSEWGSRFKKQNLFKKYFPDQIKSISMLEYPVEVRFDNFNARAIESLNEIIKETDCEIVVSSDWNRQASLIELQYLYESRGIIKPPIDITRKYDEKQFKEEGYETYNIKFSNYYDRDLSRIMEIKAYLKDHPEVTNWVAVDDLIMGIEQWENGLTNFVFTNEFKQGIMDKEVKCEIIKYLNE